MRRLLLILLVCLPAPSLAQQIGHWRTVDAEMLAQRLDHAADEGLTDLSEAAHAVRSAISDPARLDAVATPAAIRLLRAYRGECCGPARPADWHIARTEPDFDAASSLDAALRGGRLRDLFEATQPTHRYYSVLSRAFSRERDPAKRRILAINLARWRWMPRQMGDRYLLVNVAAFEVTLWERQEIVGRWRAIVGRPRSPSPVFDAIVSGVVVNPWWEIPSSIAAEGIASMVRNRPAEARRRGYVYENGRYRQRPGEGNALGRMKLVMPNPYSVFLHDTSSRRLFARDERALSHGCIRVGNALEFVTTLLAPQGWDRARVDSLVESGETVTVSLEADIPVYIAYFTAEPDGEGGIRFFDDIYGRDAQASRTLALGANPSSECAES